MGTTLPSTSHPPDVIHMIGILRPSPFFALFLFHFHVFTEHKSNYKKHGRPGNEARIKGGTGPGKRPTVTTLKQRYATTNVSDNQPALGLYAYVV